MFIKATRIKMLTRQFSVLAMLISTVAFVGCDAFRPGIPGSGTVKSESRAVVDFDQIEIEGIGTINVTFGETPSVRLSFDDNLLEYVTTDVENGVLNVSLSESISSNNSLTIDIVTPKLTQVKIEGAAKVLVHEAKLDDLKIISSGACQFVADGLVENLELDLSGASRVDANELRAKSVKISVSGAAKADLYASDSLDASVSGAGVVNCLGRPTKVAKKLNGVGRINVDK